MISGSVLKMTVQPGDNITLYCDCKLSTGISIVWFRNCSHENQPPLVITFHSFYSSYALGNPTKLPRFDFVKNSSSDSYDLLIMNASASDEGSYYCGTRGMKLVGEKQLTKKDIYVYSNVTTKITVEVKTTLEDCSFCWKLLFYLCPAVSVLSALISSLLVHRLCQKTAKKSHNNERKHEARSQTRKTQAEDVCYAALETQQSSHRPKKKRLTQSSDFSLYSAIRTSRV
ncbi:uncharacterized protein LOC133451306 [Cololabis saira]|uniref:uncharacterized protein LOC133451306 n=1 Tax=Cololabis saira TaxID=129043 RepID=UPI002AD5417A|nr:uncharacterized protein LOC133451306 [Cololabis saira]